MDIILKTNSKIIVLIDGHPKTPILLRIAQRKARELNQSWLALHIDTEEYKPAGAESRERVGRFLKLAEQMGAEVRRVASKNFFDGLVAFLENSLTELDAVRSVIVGRSNSEGLSAIFRPHLGDRLTRRFHKRLPFQIVPLDQSGQMVRWWHRDRIRQTRGAHVLQAIVIVSIAYALGDLARRFMRSPLYDIDTLDIPLIFLIATTFVAARIGFLAGIVSTGLSVLGLIHFYLLPTHREHFDRADDYTNMLFFLGASLLITLFGSHVRANAESASRREKRTQALFKINRLTANAQSREEALGILHESLSDLLEMEVAYFLPPALNPDAIAAAYPAGIELAEDAQKALESCWRETILTGFGTGSHKHISWHFEPLITQSGEIGVMGVNIVNRRTLDMSFSRLISALADHSAQIIERIEGARMMEASRIREEREKLRSMLLSSVSHDLKTPLASIIGSLSVYHSMRATLPEERQLMLTQTALDEAQRLDSFISNILDMTRLESGDITARPEWTLPLDLVMRVKKRMRQRLHRHQLHVVPIEEKIEVEMDVTLTEQVLQNILDNAAKYSSTGSEIEIALCSDGSNFCFKVRDRGPGIPAGKEESIFDKYSRLKMEDSQVAGTGLGLAISRAMMDSQHGSVTVSNRPEGGAEFTIRFPSVRTIDEKSDQID